MKTTPISLFEALQENAKRLGPQTAWIELASVDYDERNRVGTRQADSEIWTWQDVHDGTLKLAQRLISLGVKRHSRVANVTRNSLDWVLVDLACSAIGAIHSPIDPRLSVAARFECIEKLRPSLLVFHPDQSRDFSASGDARTEGLFLGIPMLSLDESREWMRESPVSSIPHPVESDDVACILFTSGTTGASQGVMLSHRNLVSNALAKLDAMPEQTDDLRLNFLPFAHAYAKTGELGTWLLSGCSMATTQGIRGVIECMPRVHPTLLNGVPRFYESLFDLWQKRGGDASDLRALLGNKMRRLASGGAPLRQSIREAFADAKFPIYQGYGLTEASPVVCSNREATSERREELDGVGPPVSNVELRIDSEKRLWVRGCGVMVGYWENEELTAERIQAGWLDTRDRAEWIATSAYSIRPSLRILGRADDVIVLDSGYKIDPLQIEQRIREVDGVCEAIVVARDGGGIALLVKTIRNTIDGETFDQIRMAVSETALKNQPVHLVHAMEEWSIENGLMNWKGGAARASLQRFYATAKSAYLEM